MSDERWPLQSCIGELVPAGGDLSYTLFVFDRKKNQFNASHQIITQAASAVAGAAIREHWIIDQVAAERRLTSLGGVVSSAAHELKGRLSVMEAVGTVSRGWQQVPTQPAKLNDNDFLQSDG